jgi:predicted RND superfamily exporter protein
MLVLFNNTVPDRLLRFVERRSGAIIILTVALTFFLGAFLPQLRFENKPGQLDLPPDDPIRTQLDAFSEQFKTGTVLIVGIDYGRPIRKNDLIALGNLTEELKTIHGAPSVSSITNAVGLSWTPTLGAYTLRPQRLLGQFENQPDSSLSASLQKLATHPLYGDNLVSRDARATAVVINISPDVLHGRGGIRRVRDLLADVTHLADRHLGKSASYHIAGTPAIDLALQEAMRRDLSIFAPLSVLAFLVILAASYRSTKPVLMGAMAAGLSLVWSLGILPLTDTPMSLSLTMLVPLVLSMSLVYSIHFLTCYMRQTNEGADDAQQMRTCFQHLIVPSLLCGATTCVGFFSLGTSPLPGIRDVGIFVGVGMVACVWMSAVFLPVVLMRLPTKGPKTRSTQSGSVVTGVISAMRGAIMRHPGGLVLAVLVLTVVTGLGLFRFKVETNHLAYLKNDREITESFEFVDQQFGGVLPLEVVITVPARSSASAVKRMLLAERDLRELDGLGSVVSAADLISDAERIKPQGTAPLIPHFDLARGFLPGKLWQLLDRPSVGGAYVIRGDTAITLRIACRAHVQSSERLQTLLEEVQQVVDMHLGEYQPVVTGIARYFVGVERYVVLTQIWSFAIALAVTVLLLAVMSGSWQTGLAVVAVNVIPVLMVLGMMGWFGIPLDIITVMIASIAIGIVVDDTLHLLYRYRLEEARGSLPRLALQTAFSEVGEPVATGTLILFVGFVVLVPARFLPTAYFGGLSALTVLVAALADMLLLPALLAVLLRWKQPAS